MPEPVKTLGNHAASLIGAVNLAVILWLGATVQELDKTLPLIVWRLEVLEAQSNGQGGEARLEYLSLKNGIDNPESLRN